VSASTLETGRESPAGSLRPVLAAIPADAYDNPTWKGLAYFGRDLVVYGACVLALIHWSNRLASTVTGLSCSCRKVTVCAGDWFRLPMAANACRASTPSLPPSSLPG